MHPPIASAIPPEAIGSWLALIGFGSFHGLNPGMGWLFALSIGLQRQSAQAIWVSLIPIALGHAASVALVAVILLAGLQVVPLQALHWVTALLLLGFGVYKIFTYYRHPRWVGMKVTMRDLVWWSFLMATAHGAGLMIVPALLGVESAHTEHAAHGMGGGNSALLMALGVGLHTAAMLVVMGIVAWAVYTKFGLAVLRSRWINFDLIWAVALVVVGGIALAGAIWDVFASDPAMVHTESLRFVGRRRI